MKESGHATRNKVKPKFTSFCCEGKKSISCFTGSNPTKKCPEEDDVKASILTTPPAPPQIIIYKGQHYGVFYVYHALLQGPYIYSLT